MRFRLGEQIPPLFWVYVECAAFLCRDCRTEDPEKIQIGSGKANPTRNDDCAKRFRPTIWERLVVKAAGAAQLPSGCWGGKAGLTSMSANDPLPTPTLLRSVAALQWKPVITDDWPIETKKRA